MNLPETVSYSCDVSLCGIRLGSFTVPALRIEPPKEKRAGLYDLRLTITWRFQALLKTARVLSALRLLRVTFDRERTRS